MYSAYTLYIYIYFFLLTLTVFYTLFQLLNCSDFNPQIHLFPVLPISLGEMGVSGCVVLSYHLKVKPWQSFYSKTKHCCALDFSSVLPLCDLVFNHKYLFFLFLK